jgi:hypothetical protein
LQKRQIFAKQNFAKTCSFSLSFSLSFAFRENEKIGIRFKPISIVAKQELHQIDGIGASMKIDDFNCLQIQKGN